MASPPVAARTVGGAYVIADTRGMERAQWLHLRRQGIGGSDAAAVCGLNPYRSAFEVWVDKTQLHGDDSDMSEAARWGTLLEPIVRQEVEIREGLFIEPVTGLLRHPDHEWMLANIDGAAWHGMENETADQWRRRHSSGPEGIYEGKTANWRTATAWGDDDQPTVPDAYMVQVQHYLAVTGLSWVVVACLVDGQRLMVRHVQRDEALISHLIDIEADFWRRVQDHTPPAPDGSRAATEFLAHLWEAKQGSILTLEHPDPVIELLAQRASHRQLAEDATRRAAECENRLKALLGDREEAQHPDGRTLFTWRLHERRDLDRQTLRQERPDVWASYVTTTSYRRFHVPKGVLDAADG